jgi:hypothetical protein
MVIQQNLEDFSSELTKILIQEIENGNEIVETSKGWPNQNAIIVILKKPFIKEYKIKNVEFRNINDIHYWKDEYYDSSTNHLLACKF